MGGKNRKPISNLCKQRNEALGKGDKVQADQFQTKINSIIAKKQNKCAVRLRAQINSAENQGDKKRAKKLTKKLSEIFGPDLKQVSYNSGIPPSCPVCGKTLLKITSDDSYQCKNSACNLYRKEISFWRAVYDYEVNKETTDTERQFIIDGIYKAGDGCPFLHWLCGRLKFYINRPDYFRWALPNTERDIAYLNKKLEEKLPNNISSQTEKQVLFTIDETKNTTQPPVEILIKKQERIVELQHPHELECNSFGWWKCKICGRFGPKKEELENEECKEKRIQSMPKTHKRKY